MEMKITVHKYLHKEAGTISTIEKISEVIPMKWEFIIMSSRIKDKSGIKFVKDQ